MDVSERNKKVALARWKNYRDAQEKKMAKGKEADYWKAAVCGFLAGDGSVQVRKDKNQMRHQLDFFPDNDFMRDTYLQAIQMLYLQKLSVRIRHNVYAVRISSRVIVEDILKYAIFGIKRWNIPKSLLYNNKNKAAWLRAFYSAEGYVGDKQIKIQTVNKQGMLEVSKLLNDLGVRHNFYEYSPKSAKHSRVSIIIICKRGDRERFLKKVGFWHSKKEARLKETLGL